MNEWLPERIQLYLSACPKRLDHDKLLQPPRADGTCFRPMCPAGEIVAEAGRTRANTWWPVDVPRSKGDAGPFIEHVRKLLPGGRDADIALAYLAACVKHQGHKFPWAIVLQGVEGNGKTLLSECLSRAVGSRYVHWPKASQIAKNFNAWLVGKVLYLVEDIHTSQDRDVIEELKPMITGGSGLEIEAKGVDQVSAEICGNFVFNTNHAAGVRKTRNDRRFCWLACAQQDVDDLARDGMSAAYFASLQTWLREHDGFAIVAEFLWTYAIPDDLNPARGCIRAPATTSTAAAIEAGLGYVEQEVREAVDEGRPGFRGGWVSSMMVSALVKSLPNGRNLSPHQRKEMMKALGYFPHPVLERGQTDNLVLPDGGRPILYVQKGHASLSIGSRGEVAKAYTAAQAG